MQTSNNQALSGRYILREAREVRGDVELFDAHDQLLDRPVSVQILTPQGATRPERARAFLRHQQIASGIHNCPLLAVYDAGTWEGRPFSVMERDKGAPPESLHRPGYPSDISMAVRVARQVADALACCREAGLADWVFSPDAVRIDQEGNACLAVVEGLDGPFTSSSPSTDASALAATLNLVLTGKPDPGLRGLKEALVPPWFIAILEKVDPGLGAHVGTARELESQLETFEENTNAPTEAYVPLSEPVAGDAPAQTAPLASLAALADAPTLQAKVPAPDPVSRTTALPEVHSDEVHTVPPSGTAVSEPAPRRPAMGLLVVIALLGLAVLAALTVPRLAASRQERTAASAAPLTATVPSLVGKNLDDARTVVGQSGLNLSTGQPVYNASMAKDLIAVQEPAPGMKLQAGQLVTVTLSLGPEPVQAQPASQPASKPAAQPAQPQPAPKPNPPPKGPPPKEHKDDGKKGKGGK